MTSTEVADRFNRTLMVFDELSQTILKGHLLLEEELSGIVDRIIGEPEIISEARLTFFQKLKLVQAAYGAQIRSENWRLIEKLNSLRNQMAHQLDSPKVPKVISEIGMILGLESSPLSATKEAQIETVAMALIVTYGDLMSLREKLPARKT